MQVHLGQLSRPRRIRIKLIVAGTGEYPSKAAAGPIRRRGQQKGVDLRIGLDLVAHARSGTADVFFDASGDDDLTEAVEEAQAHGVQVILLAVPSPDDKPHAVSRHLLRATDGFSLDLTAYREEPDDEQIDQVIATVIESFRNSASVEARNALAEDRPSIPPDIDRALLIDLSDAVGTYELGDSVRVRLRSRFWQYYDELWG